MPPLQVSPYFENLHNYKTTNTWPSTKTDRLDEETKSINQRINQAIHGNSRGAANVFSPGGKICWQRTVVCFMLPVYHKLRRGHCKHKKEAAWTFWTTWKILKQKTNTAYHHEQTVFTMIHGGGSIMSWRWVCWEELMAGGKYKTILEGNLLC